MGHPIRFDARLALRGENSMVSSEGRPACTLAYPLATFSGSNRQAASQETAPIQLCTLLVVKIVTGRKHQIRAHLSAAGHPVVCDGRYGRPRLAEDLVWCPRNFLH